jgi:hypothetical protein
MLNTFSSTAITLTDELAHLLGITVNVYLFQQQTIGRKLVKDHFFSAVLLDNELNDIIAKATDGTKVIIKCLNPPNNSFD